MGMSRKAKSNPVAIRVTPACWIGDMRGAKTKQAVSEATSPRPRLSARAGSDTESFMNEDVLYSRCGNGSKLGLFKKRGSIGSKSRNKLHPTQKRLTTSLMYAEENMTKFWKEWVDLRYQRVAKSGNRGKRYPIYNHVSEPKRSLKVCGLCQSWNRIDLIAIKERNNEEDAVQACEYREEESIKWNFEYKPNSRMDENEYE